MSTPWTTSSAAPTTEYAELKDMKRRSDASGNPDELEEEIAWRFGRLLSYSDERTRGLLSRRG